MRRIFFLCLLSAMLWNRSLGAQATSQPQWEYSNGALEMTVEHAKPQHGVAQEGENLYGILTIRLKNTSGETLTVIDGNPDCDHAIEIRDSSGRSPKLTPLGEHLPKSEAEREVCPVVTTRILELAPGKEDTVLWYINRLFQLEPGQNYSVRVTRMKGLPAKTSSGRQLQRVLSRTLTFK